MKEITVLYNYTQAHVLFFFKFHSSATSHVKIEFFDASFFFFLISILYYLCKPANEQQREREQQIAQGPMGA